MFSFTLSTRFEHHWLKIYLSIFYLFIFFKYYLILHDLHWDQQLDTCPVKIRHLEIGCYLSSLSTFWQPVIAGSLLTNLDMPLKKQSWLNTEFVIDLLSGFVKRLVSQHQQKQKVDLRFREQEPAWNCQYQFFHKQRHILKQ